MKIYALKFNNRLICEFTRLPRGYPHYLGLGWRWCPVCININPDQVNLDAIYQTDHENFVHPDWLIIAQGYPDGMEHLKQSLIKRLDNYE